MGRACFAFRARACLRMCVCFLGVSADGFGYCRFADKATDSLLAVHVFVSVKPGTEEAFKKASVDNHLNSIQVPYPTTLASNPFFTA
jgi:hypothetical protein